MHTDVILLIGTLDHHHSNNGILTLEMFLRIEYTITDRCTKGETSINGEQNRVNRTNKPIN